ncbi:bifunctional sugar-1-phosphate nucleotidylyltransferase/acetyltransferase [Thermogladius sp. 4427co]|uniref:bifunctional sugar-1-phosphate nucleotidylyltransferase/acetyltransferase n=1 Tax=Thermogladius sp. 4427co TaxID=3450718 RepID=UPI003F78DED4
MKAIILAAGKGERLKPITETRPKPLIPVLCKPILAWQLEWLEQLPEVIDEVIIIVGEMKEKVIEFVKSLKTRIPVRIVYQENQLGTGDAVLKGVEGLAPGEDVLIIYGDIYLVDPGLIRKVATVDGNSILGVEVDEPWKYGVLIVEGDLLVKIIEKPEGIRSGIVNAGVYKLRVSDILANKRIELSPRGEYELTDIVSKIAASSGVRVVRAPRGSWIDVGYPWHVIEANKMALSSIRGVVIEGEVEEPVYIRGDVYIGKGSTIKAFTYIEGPVYIGRNVRIGPSARIRPYSVICDGSVIGFSVEVKESVLFENVHASHLAYIGDSIICEEVNLGAGTITANLRFDEKNVKMKVKGQVVDTGRKKMGSVIGAWVRTGVNVSIMPGVKIGSYSWIYPGAVVREDVPPKTIIKSETKILTDVIRVEDEHRRIQEEVS